MRKRPKAVGPRKDFLQLYQVAVAAVDTAATVREALQTVLNLVCAHTGWPIGHAYLRVSGGVETLVPSRIWHCAAPDRFATFRRAARLHDIGKIGIPDSILLKPMGLTEAHQERWDGTGYPDGLLDEEIPLGARILAVVDAYSAITDDRPYKRAQTHNDAIAEIRRCGRTQFDPRVVEVFCQILEQTGSPVP